MHFSRAMRYLIVLLVVVGPTLTVVGVLSLPRAYVLMATTTSTRDTGLLPYLLPQFTADTGIGVRYISVGTGQALDAGRPGDVDVFIGHAPTNETQIMAACQSASPNIPVYNSFVIVDPTGA